MEEEIQSLRSDLHVKDGAIEQLTTSLSELSSKMERIEKSSSIVQHRVGELRVHAVPVLQLIFMEIYNNYDLYLCT